MIFRIQSICENQYQRFLVQIWILEFLTKCVGLVQLRELTNNVAARFVAARFVAARFVAPSKCCKTFGFQRGKNAVTRSPRTVLISQNRLKQIEQHTAMSPKSIVTGNEPLSPYSQDAHSSCHVSLEAHTRQHALQHCPPSPNTRVQSFEERGSRCG